MLTIRIGRGGGKVDAIGKSYRILRLELAEEIEDEELFFRSEVAKDLPCEK